MRIGENIRYVVAVVSQTPIVYIVKMPDYSERGYDDISSIPSRFMYTDKQYALNHTFAINNLTDNRAVVETITVDSGMLLDDVIENLKIL